MAVTGTRDSTALAWGLSQSVNDMEPTSTICPQISGTDELMKYCGR